MRLIKLIVCALLLVSATGIAQPKRLLPNLADEMPSVLVNQSTEIANLVNKRIYGSIETMDSLRNIQNNYVDAPTPITNPTTDALKQQQELREKRMREAKERELKRKRNSNTIFNSTHYRVQVYSSNEQHNAKSNAIKVENMLTGKVSQPVYVLYAPPFWKVRVGDFVSYDKALEFKNALIKQFPQLQTEAYIVREQ